VYVLLDRNTGQGAATTTAIGADAFPLIVVASSVIYQFVCTVAATNVNFVTF